MFERLQGAILNVFLFLLPWPTIWIYREIFAGGAKWEFGTLGFYFTEGLLWSMVFLAVCRMVRALFDHSWTREQFSWTGDRQFLVAVFGLLVYIFLSLLWATDVSLAHQSALRFLAATLLFFLLLNRTAPHRNIVGCLAAGGIVQSLLGIAQFFFQKTWSSSWFGLASHPVWDSGTAVVATSTERWLRAYGAFTHPNVFGGYLAVVFAMILLLAWHGRIRQKIFFSLTAIAAAVLGVGIVYSWSRSAWISAGVSLIVAGGLGWWHKRLDLLLIVFGTGVCMTVSAAWFLPLMQVRVQHQTPLERRSIEERTASATDAVQIFSDHSVRGVGIGNYTAYLFSAYPERPGWFFQPVHNIFLLWLAELGLIGFGLVLAVGVAGIRFLRRFHGENWVLFLWGAGVFFPLGFFDHYLLTTFVGISLSAIFLAFLIRLFIDSPSQRKKNM